MRFVSFNLLQTRTTKGNVNHSQSTFYEQPIKFNNIYQRENITAIQIVLWKKRRAKLFRLKMDETVGDGKRRNTTKLIEPNSPEIMIHIPLYP